MDNIILLFSAFMFVLFWGIFIIENIERKRAKRKSADVKKYRLFKCTFDNGCIMDVVFSEYDKTMDGVAYTEKDGMRPIAKDFIIRKEFIKEW